MVLMVTKLGVRTYRNRLQWERAHLNDWGWWGSWKAWWREWFVAYVLEVYKGIVQEFVSRLESLNLTK